MLTIEKSKKKRKITSIITLSVAILLMAGGLYTLLLATSPMLIGTPDPIDVTTLEEPKAGKNQLIIPKIGVNIAYGTNGEASLDAGAWWRYPERGNPTGEGNFIIAAHRFTIQRTPQSTVEKSPFYNIDKLESGDTILVDYEGKRYAYEVSEMKEVDRTAVEIEAPSEEPKMTLYSCGLGGEQSGRLVVIARPVGEVDVSATSDLTE